MRRAPGGPDVVVGAATAVFVFLRAVAAGVAVVAVRGADLADLRVVRVDVIAVPSSSPVSGVDDGCCAEGDVDAVSAGVCDCGGELVASPVAVCSR